MFKSGSTDRMRVILIGWQGFHTWKSLPPLAALSHTYPQICPWGFFFFFVNYQAWMKLFSKWMRGNINLWKYVWARLKSIGPGSLIIWHAYCPQSSSTVWKKTTIELCNSVCRVQWSLLGSSLHSTVHLCSTFLPIRKPVNFSQFVFFFQLSWFG